jgi:hypothetical protein
VGEMVLILVLANSALATYLNTNYSKIVDVNQSNWNLLSFFCAIFFKKKQRYEYPQGTWLRFKNQI